MKQIAIVIVLSVLMISGCATTAQNNEVTISDESDNKSEVTVIADKSGSNSYLTEDEEPSFSDMHPNSDIYLELDLEDGKFYEIPCLNEEEEAVFIASDNCAKALMMRLKQYGVLLNPAVIEEDRASSWLHYSMFVCRYKDFDLLYIQYSAYRGTHSGDLYIFQNSLLKKYISDTGEVDLGDCFRTMGENIWFAATRHSGGSAMALQKREWINLTNDDVPVELIYTNSYGQGNFSHGLDVDFWVGMGYRVLDEELYINEQDTPILKIKWQKEVHIEDRTYEEIFSLTANGYDENVIGTSVDWEDFNPYDLSCGNLLDGLGEQLDELMNNGTEEEQRIAKQLVEKFTAMSIY